MTTKPEISVVMPAYNAAPHIGGAVASVLASTVREVELIVVDDGSTDETAAIAEAHGHRVRVLQQPNGGVSVARNRGIATATAPIVALCDADDILFPTYLQALLDVHRAHGGVTTANAYWLFPAGIDPRKTRHTGRFPAPPQQRRAILEQNFVSTMSAFPRGLVDDIGGFDESLRHGEDWDFWMRAVYGGHVVSHQPRPLALYRWTEDGLTSQTGAMAEGVAIVLRRSLERLPLRDDEANYVRLRLASAPPQALLRTADQALTDGRYGEAATAYAAASALVPSDSRVALKARLLRVAPSVGGRLLRWEARRTDARRGSSTSRTR